MTISGYAGSCYKVYFFKWNILKTKKETDKDAICGIPFHTEFSTLLSCRCFHQTVINYR